MTHNGVGKDYLQEKDLREGNKVLLSTQYCCLDRTQYCCLDPSSPEQVPLGKLVRERQRERGLRGGQSLSVVKILNKHCYRKLSRSKVTREQLGCGLGTESSM